MSAVPLPSYYEQECTDIVMAHSELRTAHLRLHHILTKAMAEDPAGYNGDVSVYIARLQVNAAEKVLRNVINHYDHVFPIPPYNNAAAANGPTANGPPTNIGPVIEIEDSDKEDKQGNTPAYTSWPSTPTHFYAALIEEGGQQGLNTPTTPPRCSQDAGGSSQLLSPPPCAQPRHTTPATPLTPRHIMSQPTTIIGEGGLLTSPTPSKKHYIVTKGRRTGIYRAWPIAQAYVCGLGSAAAWQSFDSYTEAFDAYMGACERGLLKIVRLPNDSVEAYGPIDSAEDI